MINSAQLQNFRIKEFIQFITNNLMIIKDHGPDLLKIKPLYRKLQEAAASLSEAYKQSTSSELTPVLASLDLQRDQAIISMRQIAEGYGSYPDEAMQKHGRNVLQCIDKYGSRLYQLNYGAETAALKNVARDLQTLPECIEAVEAMHLDGLLKLMDQKNAEFEKRFVERLGKQSQYDGQTTSELMKNVTEAYRTLVQHITAHATLSPSEDYDALIRHINENVDHFNYVLQRRRSGADVEADSEAPEAEVEADESTEA